jgi:diacylglycerol kinase family enzyme
MIEDWKSSLAASAVHLCVTSTLEEFRDHVSHQYGQGSRRFLIVGGDGTFHRTVNEIHALGLPFNDMILAFLPRGSGNDWSGHQGLNTHLSYFLQAIEEEKTYEVPLGKLTFPGKEQPHLFLNIAGIGFDAFVVDQVETGGKKGKMSYMQHVVSSLRQYQSTRIRWTIEEESQEAEVFSMHVGMGRTAGGGMAILPHKDADPSLMKVTIVKKASAGKYLRSVPRLLTGNLGGLSFVDLMQARSIHIDADQDTGVECDGEALGLLPCTIEFHKDSLRVLDTRKPPKK